MKKANVFIQGPAYYMPTSRVFTQNDYQVVDTVRAADMVVWTGGDDIFPGLYGEKPISGTHFDKIRDERDLQTVKVAVELGKFLVGICRGAQLLNCIPNGGTLWQDVNNHGGYHQSFDCLSGTMKELNSVHHQAMRPTDDAEIICWALESTHKKAYGDTWYKQSDVTKIPLKEKDMEVLYYPKTKSFCFQAHPEFGHPPTTEYFFDILEKLYKRAA